MGFIKVHILYHASQAPISGTEIADELRRHGYNLSPGTLYPTLHRLVRQGYLQGSSRIVGGRVRKYYTATEEGRQALEQAEEKIRVLVDEVLG